MSLETVLLRIADLQAATRPPAVQRAARAVGGDFARVLQQAQGPSAVAAGAPAGGGNSRMVALAQGEVGQAESPPGSNDSPRISQYRSAVPGGPVGPWCAYFASWLARENGTPLGDNGQGFARVDDVWAWGQRTGRATPAGPGATPQPGDLIIWDEHMGVVESVLPDGSIQTIEGNSSDQVSRRLHKPGPPIVGFVRPG